MGSETVDLPFAGDKTWNRVERYLDVRPNRRPRHADSFFHASQIRRMCPIFEYWNRTWLKQMKKARGKNREKLQKKVHACLYADRPKASLQSIFDLGTVLHTKIQYYYGVIGLLVGTWRCPICGHVEGDPDEKPIKMPREAVISASGHKIYDFAICPKCKKNHKTWPHWEYVEPFAIDVSDRIAGSTDGFIDYRYDGKLYQGILEVKSINENGFNEKYGEPLPKADHVFQASIYMHLFGREWALILYYNKNKSQVKEFLVPKDPNAWTYSVRRSRATTQALKKQKPPSDDWRTCQKIKDPAARSCPAAFECWGEHPPENFMSA